MSVYSCNISAAINRVIGHLMLHNIYKVHFTKTGSVVPLAASQRSAELHSHHDHQWGSSWAGITIVVMVVFEPAKTVYFATSARSPVNATTSLARTTQFSRPRGGCLQWTCEAHAHRQGLRHEILCWYAGTTCTLQIVAIAVVISTS